MLLKKFKKKKKRKGMGMKGKLKKLSVIISHNNL